MKKYVLKGSNGLFYVKGSGFTAACKNKASALTESQLACAADLGFTGTKYDATTSFAVNYIRLENLDANGQVKPDTRNPSKRRFATRDEAIQHGKRFGERRAKAKGSKAGSAGHIGFYVTESSDPVNAAINWKTGLTNPVTA